MGPGRKVTMLRILSKWWLLLQCRTSEPHLNSNSEEVPKPMSRVWWIGEMKKNWLEQRLGHQYGNHAYSVVCIFFLLLHKKVGTLLAIAISIQPRFFTWTILEEMILILHWWAISVLACIASSDRWARLLSIFILSQHSPPTNEYRPGFSVGINKGDSCWISNGPWYSTCKGEKVCACFYSNHLTPSIQIWRHTVYDHFWPCCLSKHKNTSKQSQNIQIYRSKENRAWTCAERLSEKYKVTSPAPASISTWLQNGIRRAVRTNLVTQSNPYATNDDCPHHH